MTMEDKEDAISERREDRHRIASRVDALIRKADAEARGEAVPSAFWGGVTACLRRLFRGRSSGTVAQHTTELKGVANGPSAQNGLSLALFGSRRSSNGTEAAASKLAAASEQILARAQTQREKSAKARSLAKELAQKNQRPQAIAQLKRAKQLDASASKLESASVAIQQQSDVLEESSLHVEVAKALSSTKASLKMSKKALSKVESAVDDTSELADANDDIQSVLATLGDGMSSSLGIDDDDLAAELDGMMEDDVEKEPVNAPISHGKTRAQSPELGARDFPMTPQDVTTGLSERVIERRGLLQTS